MSWISYLAVFVGGGLGSICRFLVSRMVVSTRYTNNFPLATLLANIGACVVMAIVLYFGFKEKWINEDWKLFWLVGFCGGFSTFSTFSYENWLLYKEGMLMTLIANVLISVLLCLGIFLLAGRYFTELR